MAAVPPRPRPLAGGGLLLTWGRTRGRLASPWTGDWPRSAPRRPILAPRRKQHPPRYLEDARRMEVEVGEKRHFPSCIAFELY